MKVLANQDVYGSDCLRPCGITQTILPNVARPGHPTSSFYRMSKSERNRGPAGAHERWPANPSESMMRSSLTYSCSLLCLYRPDLLSSYHQSWSSETRLDSKCSVPRCPALKDEKLTVPAVWLALLSGQTGLCNLTGPWTS